MLQIMYGQARASREAESAADSAACSLIAARGVDAQALFNFLLNSRAINADAVPPTLLAPTAFHGAALTPLKVLYSLTKSFSQQKY